MSAEDIGDLQDLTFGTESLMFPGTESQCAREQPMPQLPGSEPSHLNYVKEHRPMHHAMHSPANHASPPGTTFVDSANNYYVIDPNGFAVPLRLAPAPDATTYQGHLQQWHRKKPISHAHVNLNKSSRGSPLFQCHTQMIQAVRQDRIMESSSTNRYGFSDTMSDSNSGSNTSRESINSSRLGLLTERKCREWFQIEQLKKNESMKTTSSSRKLDPSEVSVCDPWTKLWMKERLKEQEKEQKKGEKKNRKKGKKDRNNDAKSPDAK